MPTRPNRITFWSLAAVLLTVLVSVPAIVPPPVAAQVSGVNGCIQDVWQAHGNTQGLTCTANDVRIAEVTNITVVQGGSGSCTSTSGDCSCTAAFPAPTNCGTNPDQAGCVTFTADFLVQLTAQTRYDVGLYIATDNGGADGALTGQCFDSVITQQNAPATFFNPDPTDTSLKPLQPGDICGDIENTAAHNPQIVHLTVSVACVAGPDGKLNLPNCTSWRQPGSNTECNDFSDAFPGSPSKCNCQPQFPVNIRVAAPSITVTKTADPTSVQEPGGDVTFTVEVHNSGTQAVQTVTLTSLIDDTYGDLNGLGTCAVPQTIAPGGTYTCQFVGAVSGNAGETKTDEVCASGHDANSPPNDVGPTCDTADVTITNLPSSATLVKTVASATVTYKVVVNNTSAADALTLTQLCDDKYGDITSNGSSSPACAAGTLGSASNSTCPALPVSINAGGSVECTFDATITPTTTGTTNVTDTATGTLNDNDGNTLNPSDSATVSITQ
jgi:uncharacterized repeat protein (TIGR01451 family)